MFSRIIKHRVFFLKTLYIKGSGFFFFLSQHFHYKKVFWWLKLLYINGFRKVLDTKGQGFESTLSQHFLKRIDYDVVIRWPQLVRLFLYILWSMWNENVNLKRRNNTMRERILCFIRNYLPYYSLVVVIFSNRQIRLWC